MTHDTPTIDHTEFRALLEDANVVMLSTLGEDASIACRPMALRKVDALQPLQLWFLTREATGTVDQVDHHPTACVTFQCDERNVYVVMHGRADVVRDRDRIRASWRPMDSVFFPEGPDAESLCLVRVLPTHAVVWQGPGGLVGKSIAFVQAVATGDPGVLGHRSDVRL